MRYINKITNQQIKSKIMKKILCISLAGEKPESNMFFCVAIDAKHSEALKLYRAIMKKNTNVLELILAHQHNKEQSELLATFLTETLLPQLSSVSSIKWVAFAPINTEDCEMKCKYCINQHLSQVILHAIQAVEKNTEPYFYLPYLTR